MRYQKVSNIIMTAVMGLYAAMGAQAADTRNPSQEPNVVSSYEYQSVSYGNTADGKTYHRVVTKRNGVTESDVMTVDENGGRTTYKLNYETKEAWLLTLKKPEWFPITTATASSRDVFNKLFMKAFGIPFIAEPE